MEQGQRKLIRQVMRLCEKQYRKGFQHGAHFAMIEGDTTKADAFRHLGADQDYRKMMRPETGRVETKAMQAQLLSAECAMAEMDELNRLLCDYGGAVDATAEDIAEALATINRSE